jgi:hypothetical protein
VDEAFGVDPKRYYILKKQLEETGSLEYKPPGERSFRAVQDGMDGD